jgi:hypothetical protein
LDAGAHPDFPDSRNITPIDILHAYNNDQVQFMLSLKCIAASTVVRTSGYKNLKSLGPDQLPRNMIDYLEMHTKPSSSFEVV